MIKYIDRTTTGENSLEVSFVGMEWKDNGKKIDKNTLVTVRLLERKAQLNNEIVPYVEKWIEEFPEVLVPTGVWNGMKLGLLVSGKIFVALGESLCELSLSNGTVFWSQSYANTPIDIIIEAPDNEGIYILYSGYQFIGKGIKSNLIKVSLTGALLWSAQLQQVNDMFTNVRLQDKTVIVNTWNGWYGQMDEDTGEILNAGWTK